MFARVAVGKGSSQSKTAESVRVSRSEYSAQQSESGQPKISNLPKFLWNFCNIATHAPNERNQPSSGRGDGSGATQHAGSLPWPIQAKLEVGAVVDALDKEKSESSTVTPPDHVKKLFHRNYPFVDSHRPYENNAAQRRLQDHAQAPLSKSDRATTPRFGQIPVHAPGGGVLQARLVVNSAGDEYEQEADHVAEQVMRMPEPRLQRKCGCGGTCADCQEKQSGEESKQLQTKRINGSNGGHAQAPASVHGVLRSSGQPLDTATRAFMEPRFGHDFSRVR